MMENFLTAESLLTFGGVAMATSVVVQLVKSRIPVLTSQELTFLVALIIMLIFNAEWSVQGIALTIINACIVSLTAKGGYDTMQGRKDEIDGKQDYLYIDDVDSDNMSFKTDKDEDEEE